VFIQQTIERTPTDTEHACRVDFVPVAALQDFEDVSSLDGGQSVFRGSGTSSCRVSRLGRPLTFDGGRYRSWG